MLRAKLLSLSVIAILVQHIKCFTETVTFISRPSSPRPFLGPRSTSSLRPIDLPFIFPQKKNYIQPNHNRSKQSCTILHVTLGSATTSFTSIIETIFSTTQTVPLYLSFFINSSLFLTLRSKLNQMLTPEGFIHSLALGTMLWHTLGWRGWSTCVLYLILGQAVTKVKFVEKQAKGIAEGRGGRRGPENVWGSAATALVCAAGYVQATSPPHTSEGFLGFSPTMFLLAYTASLATKLADTFASEIGKAYGKTTFLITTLERVPPGTEGAISLEGTAAAMVGGSLLPLYAWSIGLLPNNLNYVGLATLAAFIATNVESWIGATVQGKEGFNWMTNEVVNFLNTVIGATVAVASARALFGL